MNALGRLLGKVKVLLLGGSEPEFELTERRTEHRPDTRQEVVCRSEDRNVAACMVDVSRSGMRLESSEKLAPDTVVLVSQARGQVKRGRQRLRCRVVWSRQRADGRWTCGLRFEEEEENFRLSWIQEALKKVGYEHRLSFRHRKSRRVEAAIPLEVQSRECIPVTGGVTVDVGVGGALLSLPVELAAGEVIRLALVLDETEPALQIMANVLSVRTESTGEVLHHVRFMWADPDKTLEETLKEILARSRGAS